MVGSLKTSSCGLGANTIQLLLKSFTSRPLVWRLEQTTFATIRRRGEFCPSKVSYRRARYARLYSASVTEQSEPYRNFFIERYVEAFKAEFGAFADAVEKGVAPEVGFEDGRLALLLAEAALKSVGEAP